MVAGQRRSRCRCQVGRPSAADGAGGAPVLAATCVAARQTCTSATTRVGAARAAMLGAHSGVVGVGDAGCDLGGECARPGRRGRSGRRPSRVLAQARAGCRGATAAGRGRRCGRPVSSRRQSRTAARSSAVSSSRLAAAAASWATGSAPCAASRIRWARRVGQAGSSARPGTICSAASSSASTTSRSGQVLGGDVEGVEVAGGGVAEPDGRVVLVAEQGGGGPGGVVAGQDLLEDVGGGGRADRLGPDDAVRVAVADDLQVEVVGDAAAGQHRVQLLPGLLAGGQAVHGVGGDALGGVDGGGVAELGRRLRRSRRAAGRCGRCGVCRTVRSPPSVDLEDGPPVAVLDPVGGRSAAGGRWCG